jgi:hypothetical protein
VGAVPLDFLERDFPTDLLITSHEDDAETAPLCVWPQDAESRLANVGNLGGGPVGRGVADSVEIAERRVDVEIAQFVERLPDGRRDAEGGEAAPRIVLMSFEVLLHERVEKLSTIGGERLRLLENVAEPVLVEEPHLDRGQELGLRDEIELESEHAEQQIPIGSGESGVHCGGGDRQQASAATAFDLIACVLGLHRQFLAAGDGIVTVRRENADSTPSFGAEGCAERRPWLPVGVHARRERKMAAVGDPQESAVRVTAV